MTTGAALIYQQTRSLIVKNFLLSWRNKRATGLQLFSSVFFITLLFLVQKASLSINSQTTAFTTVKDPPALVSIPIPPCEDKFFIKKPCFDFVWSGNSSGRLTSIVTAIRKNNPGRRIPASKVLAFATTDDVDAWLLSHPMRCPGALHFKELSPTSITYGVQTNSSSPYKRGKFEDPTFKFQVPLQLAAEREIARSHIGDPKFQWSFGFKEFPHPAQGKSALGSVGPAFFLAFTMFSFVLQIGSLVTEKELKLRQAMSMMGLYDSAYWLSWIIWDVTLAWISSLLLILVGMAFQLSFFLHNSFRILFLVFFLFQFNMTTFAYLLSNFIEKSTSATTAGFSVFIVAFFTQLVTVFGYPYDVDSSHISRVVWSLFSPNLLAKAVNVLAFATASDEDGGISWNRRKECIVVSLGCNITINQIILVLVATTGVWFVLALYLDNVLKNAYGMRKSPFYFLSIGYWTGKDGNKDKEGALCSCMGWVTQQEHTVPEDEDVLEEEEAVKKAVKAGIVDSNVAVQIQGLMKTYPGARKVGCYHCKRVPPYHALKGLWVNFMKDQLFCMLGPNGAGKTTAINCLTGLTPVTSGNALVYGHSIRSAVGMANIRRLIGVCPQFDILWEALSGREHIFLFASIKGLPPSSFGSIADEVLAQVKLSEAAEVRSRSYSGGMRRRLSVAIALIGEPKLVILDEPTTGMDPISRRLVWDIIQDTKRNRAIILTTHSMEEADILSDRIGIMAKGRLRCIGTSIRLKSKFGTGFVTNVSFSNAKDAQNHLNRRIDPAIRNESLKRLFKERLEVVPAEETRSFLTFVIPRDKEDRLTRFFRELQNRQAEFGISDIQLGLATLEEVFLNIASKAEVENADTEGRLATMMLSSGMVVEVPVGARLVGVPGTESEEYPSGIMVEICWETDDSGALFISDLTEMPLPRTFRGDMSATITGGGQIKCFAINPNQIASRSYRRFAHNPY